MLPGVSEYQTEAQQQEQVSALPPVLRLARGTAHVHLVRHVLSPTPCFAALPGTLSAGGTTWLAPHPHCLQLQYISMFLYSQAEPYMSSYM